MSIARLEIRLLRKNDAEDDIISVIPVVDSFKLSYIDGISNIHHFFYANEEEVVNYVEDLFYLLADDNEPFNYIQFTFPCFPAVIYKIPEFNMSHIRRTIRDRLKAVLNNWPEKFRSISSGIN